MSKLLYKGVNIVVTGLAWPEYYQVPASDKPEDIRRTVQLQFIVQVNGKMIIHYQTLLLQKAIGCTPDVQDYCLVDWKEWYTLCGIFASFWYTFTDERVDMALHSNHIIKDWLKLIFWEYALVQE